jgi:hypothetical protein
VIRTTVHADLAALRGVLAGCAVIFSTEGALAAIAGLPSSLAQRLHLHRHAGASALVVDALHPADLALLRQVSGAVLLQRPWFVDDTTGNGEGSGSLRAAGFRVFLPEGVLPQPSQTTWSTIGVLEFLLSSNKRLATYPVLGGGSAMHDRQDCGVIRPRAVFVLDLVQDFEILRPFLLLAAAPNSPIEACAAITERVLASHLAAEITNFLGLLDIPWFKPVGVADVAAALGDRRALLLTAAESSAPGHAFGHACCRVAPPRTLRATFQHGYECVGLHHHRAHELQFPQGVRFASDVIFTWRSPDELIDLHGADRTRALPVGVTKATAQRAARLLQLTWAHSVPSLPGQAALPSAQALVIAENLHSVRFASPPRYQRYLRFIDNMVARTDVRTVIRSHPGKRTVEKARTGQSYAFLEGVLTADHFMASRGLVSPPSTILLDAALCARPTAVWSDAVVLGDVQHYRGLPVVTDAADVGAAMLDTSSSCGLDALRWAVNNTTALNGVPAAWQHLRTLVA